MSKSRLDDSKVNTRLFNSRVLIHLAWFLLVLLCATATAETSNGSRRYIPPELQASDPGIKALLDSAEQSAKQGNYGNCLTSLQKAIELATKEKSTGDKTIVESRLAVYYFTQGKLEKAKSLWLGSLSDGISVSNLVLQADVLVALSALSQQGGNLEESLKGANQALDLARKSKNLYIQSRALGELSRLQLLAARPAEARASAGPACFLPDEVVIRGLLS